MIQYRTISEQLYNAIMDLLNLETCDLPQDRVAIQQAYRAAKAYEDMKKSHKKPSEKYDESWISSLTWKDKSDFMAFIATETTDDEVGKALRKIMNLVGTVKISESISHRIWIEGQALPEIIREIANIAGIDAITGHLYTEVNDV